MIFLGLGLAHLGRRGGRISAAILSLTIVLSLAAPVAGARPGRAGAGAGARRRRRRSTASPSASDSHVRMLMFDGASLDVISPAVAAGRLPNIARIFDQGAVLHLATLRPTQAEPVWSAIATGRYPMYNGVRSAVVYRALGGTPIQLLPDYCFAQALVTFGFLTEEPQTATDLLARPIWNILSDRGASVGVIGWPLTHPAPVVNGFAVSDAFHRLPRSRAEPGRDAGAVAELDCWRTRWRRCRCRPIRIRCRWSPRWARRSRSTTTTCAATRRRSSPIACICSCCDALEINAPRFLAVRFPGIDAVGHRFLRYADPSAFGDVSEAEREQFGGVLNQYYGFIDTLVGREIERLGPNDLLLVVSAFGMEPLSPGKRVLEIIAGNPQISGTHERAPDGFVLAFGAPVAAGPAASCIGRRPGADDSVFPRATGRPRHGWLRAN